MHFQATEVPGLFVIDSEPSRDSRGDFARIHSSREFAEKGLSPCPEQCSLSRNRRRGTVRGLHYQVPPHAEAKLVCCVAGSAFDVVVDLRRASPSFGRALCFSLAADIARMIYVPQGCAHGFQTLQDDTTLLYMISTPYEPSAARGIRWNDPALAIPWPEREAVSISDRDKSLPLLSNLESTF